MALKAFTEHKRTVEIKQSIKWQFTYIRERGDRQIDREKERQRDNEQNTLRKLLGMKTIKTVDTSCRWPGWN